MVNISQNSDPWQSWKDCMETADLAWIIAPETDGALLRLNKLARESGCEVIACDDDAVNLTTSKYATSLHLSAHGIPALKSRRLTDQLISSDTGWIVKRDDGAGSDECHFFRDINEYSLWEKQIDNKDKYIQQKFTEGTPASMSVLYAAKETRLLSCNKQLVRIDGNNVAVEKIILNDLHSYQNYLQALAEKIARAIPGLRAYVGIDLILTDSGPLVLEINPRITTSYAGLSVMLNVNLAEIIMFSLGIPVSYEKPAYLTQTIADVDNVCA
jgi:predicted ATP-grasp superfamily ATP-dependent carboligase